MRRTHIVGKQPKQLELPFADAAPAGEFVSIGTAAARVVAKFKPYDENFHKNAPLADYSQPWHQYASRGGSLPGWEGEQHVMQSRSIW
jgi:hypothetical protein